MKLKVPDIITAGFPCQGMSVAGKGGGFSDDRSALFFQFIRLAERLRPGWLLIENVPGFRTAPVGAKGRDFTVALAELDKLGYGISWASLDAQWFGLAQRRERVFIVGSLGKGACPAEILFDSPGVRGHSPPRRKEGEKAAGTIGASAPSRRNAGSSPAEGHLVAGTLNSGGNKGGFRTEPGEHIVAGTLTGGERGGKSHGKKSGTDKPGFLVMAQGQANAEVMEDGCPTLNCNHEAPILAHTLRGEGFDASEDGTGRGTPIIAHPLLGKPNDSHDNSKSTYIYRTAGNCGPFEQDDKAACLNQNTDPNQQILCFEPRLARNGRGAPSGVVPPLKAQSGKTGKGDGAPCVFGVSENQRAECRLTDVSRQLSSGGGKPGQGYPAILSAFAVRRLTPLECERLQGFPEVERCMTIECCVDRQKNYASVEIQSHKSHVYVGSAEKTGESAHVKSAKKNLNTKHQPKNRHAPALVRINCAENAVEILSQEKSLLSASTVGEKRRFLPHIRIEDFVQLLVGTSSTAERIINVGRAALPANGPCSTVLQNGRKYVKLSGKEITQHARDAERDLTTSKKLLRSIISGRLPTRSIEQNLIILSSYALTVITGFILPKIPSASSLRIEIVTKVGWTYGVSDSARYRMLGLAVAVPVVQWILSNLQKAGAHTIGECFSGIGGFALAARNLGMEVLWASEICPQAQTVYAHHFPDVELVGDIRKL